MNRLEWDRLEWDRLESVQAVYWHKASRIKNTNLLSPKISYRVLFKYIANGLNTDRLGYQIIIRQNSIFKC